MGTVDGTVRVQRTTNPYGKPKWKYWESSPHDMQVCNCHCMVNVTACEHTTV